MVKIDISPFKKLDHLISSVYIITKYKQCDLNTMTMLINSVLTSNYSERDISNFLTLKNLYPDNYGVEFFLNYNIQNKIDKILKAQNHFILFLSPSVKCVICSNILSKGNSVWLLSM